MGNDGFVKIYGAIVRSSIWAEQLHVRVVWISMLTQADARGMVEASMSGLTRLANLDRDLCEDAIRVLSSPDPDSKSQAFEGRRIEPVPGGWRILNYRRYRERGTSAERVRAYRAKAKPKAVTDVTDVTNETAGNDREHDATGGNSSFASSSCSSGSTEKEKEANGALHRVTGVTKVTQLEAGELVQRIKALEKRVDAPGGGNPALIHADDVKLLGDDVLRAFKAAGGSTRFLAVSGRDLSFLVREFRESLQEIRGKGAGGDA